MFDRLNKSVKAKLQLLFFVSNLALILLIGFISYQSKKYALEEQLEQNMQVMAANLADKLDKYLSYRLADTKAVALHYSLHHFTKSTTSNQNALLAEYKRIYPHYDQINIINLEDIVLPCGDKNCPDGCQTAWYLPSLDGKTVSSDMYMSPITGTPTMSFAAPVKDDTGRVTSILTTNLNPSQLWAMIDQIQEENKKSGLSGHAFVVNRGGYLLAHPNKEKVLKETGFEAEDERLRSMVRKMTMGYTGTGEYLYEGTEKFAAFYPCTGYGDYLGHGWSLAVTKPRSEVSLPLKKLLHLYLGIFFVTSLGAFYVSTKLSEYITRPILALKEGASRIGSGDFDFRIKAASTDEIGELAGSFNNMAVTLDARDRQIRAYTEVLTSMNEELEKQQGELKKTNENLQATNRELVRLEKVKDEFTAMMTHDIKSPLSTIMTYTEMILDGIVPFAEPDIKKAIGSIHASSYRILSLVDNHLVSSAIEAGRLQVKPQAMNLNEFVDTESAFFALQLEKKNIKFSLEKHEGLPFVMADRVQLERVFSNLLTNAIKFTPASSEITVRTLPSELGAAFSVSDNGGGIPEDEQADIFNKYKRARGSQKIEGTGLGLFITKTITEAHGGGIDFESIPGVGSTFTVHLPSVEA